jgi:anti-anti-sigma regulatory factor
MLGIAVTTTVDDHRSIANVAVNGPLATADQARAVFHALNVLPTGAAVLLDLDGVTTMSETGLRGLRAALATVRDRFDDVVVVAEVVEFRARLVLAELDRFAPLLINRTQARAVLAA